MPSTTGTFSSNEAVQWTPWRRAGVPCPEPVKKYRLKLIQHGLTASLANGWCWEFPHVSMQDEAHCCHRKTVFFHLSPIQISTPVLIWTGELTVWLCGSGSLFVCLYDFRANFCTDMVYWMRPSVWILNIANEIQSVGCTLLMCMSNTTFIPHAEHGCKMISAYLPSQIQLSVWPFNTSATAASAGENNAHTVGNLNVEMVFHQNGSESSITLDKQQSIFTVLFWKLSDTSLCHYKWRNSCRIICNSAHIITLES